MSKRWTIKAPVAPGFYWVRRRGERKPEVVRIVEVRGTPHVLVCGTEGASPIAELDGQSRWYGPLVLPRSAGSG